jgi:hypothetical protein
MVIELHKTPPAKGRRVPRACAASSASRTIRTVDSAARSAGPGTSTKGSGRSRDRSKRDRPPPAGALSWARGVLLALLPRCARKHVAPAASRRRSPSEWRRPPAGQRPAGAARFPRVKLRSSGIRQTEPRSGGTRFGCRLGRFGARALPSAARTPSPKAAKGRDKRPVGFELRPQAEVRNPETRPKAADPRRGASRHDATISANKKARARL